jgi:acetyl-CoA acetyltransferase
VYESHVEMDGAWALFEAWLRLQLGDIDVALVIGSGRSSPGNNREIFALQGDPYHAAPLGLDPVSLAGIQARALLDANIASEADFAAVVERSWTSAADNPNALVRRSGTVDELLDQPHYAAPLRAHDVAPVADGAAALLMVAGDRARELCERPVWIQGIEHRIESHHPGLRELTDSPSTRSAAAAVGADGTLDVAELMVTHSHEEVILRRALGLSHDTTVNPSGGPLGGHPVMATGLVRIIEVASRIADGSAQRGLAHASSGACLQQNLICFLQGDD